MGYNYGQLNTEPEWCYFIYNLGGRGSWDEMDVRKNGKWHTVPKLLTSIFGCLVVRVGERPAHFLRLMV